jgi:hypothetical protein
MGSITPLLCTLLGSVITVLLFMAAVRRGVRQISTTGAYREVSRQLGLSIDTRGTSIQGHLGDRRLWLGQVMIGQGTERKEVHWGVLDLERPLGMDLLFRRKGMSERLFRRSRQPELPIGHPHLDRSFELKAAHPEIAKNLFTPAVVENLLQLVSKWPNAIITDNAIQVHLASPPASSQTVMALVNVMVELAMSIDERRAELSAPGELEELIGPWSTLAQEKGLDFEPNIPAISGSIDRRRVLVIPRQDEQGVLHSELQLFFRPHQKTGIRLVPQGTENVVGQDIQVGNDAFDQAFIIKGYDPTAVQEKLNEGAQGKLLALAALSDCELDDRRILTRRLGLEPETLRDAITLSEEVADALNW